MGTVSFPQWVTFLSPRSSERSSGARIQLAIQPLDTVARKDQFIQPQTHFRVAFNTTRPYHAYDRAMQPAGMASASCPYRVRETNSRTVPMSEANSWLFMGSVKVHPCAVRSPFLIGSVDQHAGHAMAHLFESYFLNQAHQPAHAHGYRFENPYIHSGFAQNHMAVRCGARAL